MALEIKEIASLAKAVLLGRAIGPEREINGKLARLQSGPLICGRCCDCNGAAGVIRAVPVDQKNPWNKPRYERHS